MDVTLQGTDKYLDLFEKVIVPGAQREGTEVAFIQELKLAGAGEGRDQRPGLTLACTSNHREANTRLLLQIRG